MTALQALLHNAPFVLNAAEKDVLFSKELSALCRHHQKQCPEYAAILSGLGTDLSRDLDTNNIPFLPVRLFKTHTLKSMPDDAIAKTMTSSGTSGQQVSKIYLDKETATNQTRVLSKLVQDMLGPKRLPMLVVDAPGTVKDRTRFSARGAGILGFSMFGRDVTYALNDDMTLDEEALERFCSKHAGGPIFIFGFTSIIYQHLIEPLLNSGERLAFENAVLLHGGGWKKLEALNISNDAFKATLEMVCGIRTVHNYYGMVEQTGSIFTECSAGHLHASVFSDLIIRGADMRPLDIGEAGLVQLISLLPTSYPGHSILSEDIGEILGVDDCPCGRLGRYFKIYGRAKQAEIRGCSDTYAA